MIRDVALVLLILVTCLVAGDVRAQRTCVPAAQCCRVCTKGKACGNSCIHATFTCHKGRGCACDSSDVCR